MEQVNAALAQGKLVLVVAGGGEGEDFPSVSTVHLPCPPPGLFPSRFSLVSPTGKRLFETADSDTAREELSKLGRCFQPAPARLSVSMPGQAPRVEEFPATTLLAAVLDEFGCDSLLGKYPKREYSREAHGEQTLQALGLTDSVALVGRRPPQAVAVVQEFRVLVWLLALWNWLFPVAPQVEAPQVVAQEPTTAKKNNEYWNGDSTVFESPPD